MKFIRKGGRIIPIREKGESVDNFEKRMTKTDIKTGLGTGLVAGHFQGKPKVRLAMVAVSSLSGLRTTVARVKEHGVSKGLWEDFKSSLLKTGASAVGGAVGGVSLVGTRKLRPISKKIGAGLGDMSYNLREKFLVKRPKNVDLSKGAKTFKAKSREINKLSGLLGYKR